MVWNVLLLKHPASDVAQSGAAHDAFDGQANQTKIFFEPRRQAPFERVSGGELAVTALAGQGHQSVVRPDAPRHAKAGACAENRHGPPIRWTLLKDARLLRAEVGEAVDQDAEVIDQLKLLNASCIGQGLFLKLPGQVGDGCTPAAHRTRDGDAGGRRPGDVARPIRQKCLKHRLQGWPFSRGVPLPVALNQLAVDALIKGEECFRSAHVTGKKCWGDGQWFCPALLTG